jgi:hypothetical protein
MWGNGQPSVRKLEINEHWLGVSCGGLHYAAVSLGQSLFVWGKGKEGQLGLGPDVNFRDVPTLVPLYTEANYPLKVQRVICGPLQTAVITGSFFN